MAYTLKTELATKMAILYIIDKFKDGVTSDILTEVAVYACGINYFTLRHSLFRLEEDGFIISFYNEYGEIFVTTDKGIESLGFFVKKLPYTFREDISEYIRHLRPEELPANKFTCDFFPANDLEYSVFLEYKENGSTSLKFEFKAGDRENAEKTVRIISKNKDKIYKDLYKYIMELE